MQQRLSHAYSSRFQEPRVKELIPITDPLRRPSMDRSIEKRSSPIALSQTKHQQSSSRKPMYSQQYPAPSYQVYLRESGASEHVRSEKHLDMKKAIGSEYLDRLDKFVDDISNFEAENKRLLNENTTLWEELNKVRTLSTKQSVSEIEELARLRMLLEEKQMKNLSLQKEVEEYRLQAKSHQMETKANIIFSNHMLELTRMVMHFGGENQGDLSERDVSFEDLKGRIAGLIETNREYRREMERAESLIRDNQHHCNQELQGVINKLNDVVFQKNELELRFFDLKEENVTINQCLAEARKQNKVLGEQIQSLEKQASQTRLNTQEQSDKHIQALNSLQKQKENLQKKIKEVNEALEMEKKHSHTHESQRHKLTSKLLNVEKVVTEMNAHYDQKINMLEAEVSEQKTKNQSAVQQIQQLQRLNADMNAHIQELTHRQQEIGSVADQRARDLDSAVLYIRQMEGAIANKQKEMELIQQRLNQSLVALEETKRENKNKEAQIESLKRSSNFQLQTLEKMKNSMLEQTSRSHHQKISAEEKARELEVRLVETQSRLLQGDKASSEISRLTLILKAESEAKIHLQSLNLQHTRRIQELQGLIQIKDAEVQRMGTSEASLVGEIKRLDIVISGLNTELQQLRQGRAIQSSEASKLRNQLKLQSDSNKQLQLQVQDYQAKIAELGRMIEEQTLQNNKKLLALQNEVSGKTSQKQQLRQTLQKLKENEQTYNQNIALKQSDVSVLRKQLQQLQGKQLKNTQLVQQLTNKNTELTLLSREIKQVQQLKYEVHRYQTQEQQTTHKIQHLQNQISVLEQHKNTLEKQLLKQNAHFQDALNKMRKQTLLSQNAEQAQHYESIVKELEKRVTLLHDQLESKTRMLLDAEERVKSYMFQTEAIRTQLNNTVSQYQSEIQHTRRESALLQSSLTVSHQQQLMKFQEEVFKQKIEMAKYEQLIQTLQTESVRRSREESPSEVHDRQRLQVVTELEAIIRSQGTNIKELETRNQYNAQEIKSLKSEQQNLKAQLQQANSQSRTLQETVKSLQQDKSLKIAEYQQNIKNLEKRMEEFELKQTQATQQSQKEGIVTTQLREELQEVLARQLRIQEEASAKETKHFEQLRTLKEIGISLEKQNSEYLTKIKQLQATINQLKAQLASAKQDRANPKPSFTANTTVNTTVLEDRKLFESSTVNNSLVQPQLRPTSELPTRFTGLHRVVPSHILIPSSTNLATTTEVVATQPNQSFTSVSSKPLLKNKSEQFKFLNILNSPKATSTVTENASIGSPRQIPLPSTYFQHILKTEPVQQPMGTRYASPLNQGSTTIFFNHQQQQPSAILEKPNTSISRQSFESPRHFNRPMTSLPQNSNASMNSLASGQSTKLVKMTRIANPTPNNINANNRTSSPVDVRRISPTPLTYANAVTPISPKSGKILNTSVNFNYEPIAKVNSPPPPLPKQQKQNLFNSQAYFGNRSRPQQSHFSNPIASQYQGSQLNAGYIKSRPNTAKAEEALYSTFGRPQTSLQIMNTNETRLIQVEQQGMKVYQAQDLKNQNCC